MTTLEKIKSKVTHIDVKELKKRLEIELKITRNKDTSSDNADTLLEYALYDTLLIILEVTHLKKIDENLYSIWINMIKDYWYLNKYDQLIKSLEESESSETDEDDLLEVSSIKTGDTQVNFTSKSSSININGTKYSTGTVDFVKNILREKYKEDLYRHRKFRW